MDEWAPTGFAGLPEEMHVGLVGQAVSLASVARDAGADDVFPRGGAAPLAGHDVVEVEFLPVQFAGAVLASVVVTLVYVLPGEFDFLAGKAVEKQEDDDGGHPDVELDRMHNVGAGRGLGEVVPALEVVGEVIVGFVPPHDLGMSLVKEREGAAGTADIDGLPEPVENQHMPVEQGLHTRGPAGGIVGLKPDAPEVNGQ